MFYADGEYHSKLQQAVGELGIQLKEQNRQIAMPPRGIIWISSERIRNELQNTLI